MATVADMNYEAKRIARTTSLQSRLQVKNSAGTLWAIRIHNDAGSAQYFHVYDFVGVPTGQTPIEVFKLGAGESAIYSFAYGIQLQNGIQVANSTSPTVYAGGGNDSFISVSFT